MLWLADCYVLFKYRIKCIVWCYKSCIQSNCFKFFQHFYPKLSIFHVKKNITKLQKNRWTTSKLVYRLFEQEDTEAVNKYEAELYIKIQVHANWIWTLEMVSGLKESIHPSI